MTEPFIVPALYEKYQNVTPNPAIPGGRAVDEWSLSVAMLNDTSEGGGIQQLEEHYRTFIVRLPSPILSRGTVPHRCLGTHRPSRTSRRSQARG